MIIVIDGPAGSGKSSTAKAVANQIGIQYLDSGALYRAVTWIWLEAGKPALPFLDVLEEKSIHFEYRNGFFHVSADGQDISDEIRSQVVADHVSEVASHSGIRSYVNCMMKDAVENDIYIAEGRDLGTAVFPDAVLKFYMSASLDERARRRFDEITVKGEDVTLNQVKQNLELRDNKDSSRSADPLAKASDAIEIDTTNEIFDEQVENISSIIIEKLKLKH